MEAWTDKRVNGEVDGQVDELIDGRKCEACRGQEMEAVPSIQPWQPLWRTEDGGDS